MHMERDLNMYLSDIYTEIRTSQSTLNFKSNLKLNFIQITFRD